MLVKGKRKRDSLVIVCTLARDRRRKISDRDQLLMDGYLRVRDKYRLHGHVSVECWKLHPTSIKLEN